MLISYLVRASLISYPNVAFKDETRVLKPSFILSVRHLDYTVGITVIATSQRSKNNDSFDWWIVF